MAAWREELGDDRAPTRRRVESVDARPPFVPTPFALTECETVREQRTLEAADRQDELDGDRHRMERDAYYPAPTSEGSEAA